MLYVQRCGRFARFRTLVVAVSCSNSQSERLFEAINQSDCEKVIDNTGDGENINNIKQV